MGFVQTGNTITEAYLTQFGRDLLLSGGFNVKYFSLGDSDINYTLKDLVMSANVVDVSGNNNSCLKTITVNIDIKNKINLD